MRSSFDLLLEECRGNHAAVFQAESMRYLILDALTGAAFAAQMPERLRPRPIDQSEGGCFGHFTLEYVPINIPCHVKGPVSG